MKELIEIGDIVNVTFVSERVNNKDIVEATVLYIPQATGDSWHLKTTDGKIVYIQLFERMDLIKRSDP